MANTTALGAWKDITPLARKEFICWVEDAKQKMTRERRIRRTQEELEEGQRRPCCRLIPVAAAAVLVALIASGLYVVAKAVGAGKIASFASVGGFAATAAVAALGSAHGLRATRLECLPDFYPGSAVLASPRASRRKSTTEPVEPRRVTGRAEKGVEPLAPHIQRDTYAD